MSKVYLFMFVMVVIISILFAHLISNKNNNFDDEDEV